MYLRVAAQRYRFASEVACFNVRKKIINSLTNDIFPDIEKKISTFLLQLLFFNFRPLIVFVLVPCLLEVVSDEADIMSESERTIMIHDAV